MISRHSDRQGVSVRTGADIRDAANTALADNGWTMSQFLTAALRAVADQPKQLLATLDTYRPAPKPRGRPKRSGTE